MRVEYGKGMILIAGKARDVRAALRRLVMMSDGGAAELKAWLNRRPDMRSACPPEQMPADRPMNGADIVPFRKRS